MTVSTDAKISTPGGLRLPMGCDSTMTARPCCEREGVEAFADAVGTGDLYRACVGRLGRFHGQDPTGISMVATAVVDGRHRTVLSLYPLVRRPGGGLCVPVSVDVLASRNAG